MTPENNKPGRAFETTGEFYKDIAISVDAAISVVEIVNENEIYYRYFNQAFEDLVELDTHDILGKSPQQLIDIFGSELITLILEDFRQCIREKVLVLKERQIEWQGRTRWVLRHLSPVKNDQGNVIYIVNYLLETTDLKTAQHTVLAQHRQLQDKNIALKEIIAQVEQEKKDIKENVISNLDYVLMPILAKIKLKGREQKYVNLLKKSMEDLASSFGKRVSAQAVHLTPREIEICTLIKNGLTNKEIATLINISLSTVERHRANIRKKFGIVNDDINLSTYLTSL